MVREDITETEFIKQRFEDIIGVNKLLDGIVEYVVEEDLTSDNVLFYRFRNNKNIGLFEMDKSELISEDRMTKLHIMLLTGLGTVSLIIIYSIIIANINVLRNMPLEYIISLALTHLYLLYKVIKSQITGFTTINDAIKTAIAGVSSTIPLALAVISIAIVKRAYIIIPLYIIISVLALTKYMITIFKYTDMREFE